MAKVGVSITIDVESYNYCKYNSINISRWVNDKMANEFLDANSRIKKLEDKKKEIEEEINQIRIKEKETIKQKAEKVKNLPKEKMEELKDSIRIINEKGMTYQKTRYDRYINLFGYISFGDFKEMLDYIKNM